MVKVCFPITTKYQLFITYLISTIYYPEDYKVVFLGKNITGVKEIVSRMKKTEIWNEIYIVNSFTDVIRQSKINLKKYDILHHFTWGNGKDDFNYEIYMYLYGKIKIILTEEGLLTYTYQTNSNYENIKFDKISEVWLLKPNLYVFNESIIKLKKINFVEIFDCQIKRRKILKELNYIFNYKNSDKIPSVIYFDQYFSLMGLMKYSSEKHIIKWLMKCVDDLKEFVIRLHPSDRPNKYIDIKHLTVKVSNVPFELEYLNNYEELRFNKRTFIAVSSTTIFNPFMMFGHNHHKIIYLRNIFNQRVGLKGDNPSYSLFKNYYSKYNNNFFTPTTFKELTMLVNSDTNKIDIKHFEDEKKYVNEILLKKNRIYLYKPNNVTNNVTNQFNLSNVKFKLIKSIWELKEVISNFKYELDYIIIDSNNKDLYSYIYSTKLEELEDFIMLNEDSINYNNNAYFLLRRLIDYIRFSNDNRYITYTIMGENFLGRSTYEIIKNEYSNSKFLGYANIMDLEMLGADYVFLTSFDNLELKEEKLKEKGYLKYHNLFYGYGLRNDFDDHILSLIKTVSYLSEKISNTKINYYIQGSQNENKPLVLIMKNLLPNILFRGYVDNAEEIGKLESTDYVFTNTLEIPQKKLGKRIIEDYICGVGLDVKNNQGLIELDQKITKLVKTQNRNISCLIWGAGQSGKITFMNLKNYKDVNIIGFVDKFKKGQFCGENIYKKEQIFNMDFDYCFICTDGGRNEAEDFLAKKGFKIHQNYDYGFLI